MADIQVYKDSDLAQCASEYLRALDTLKDSVTTYQGALNALKSDWTGRAAAIMAIKVADMIGKMTKSFAKLEDAVNELGAVRDIMGEAESANKTQVGGLDAGDASPFQ